MVKILSDTSTLFSIEQGREHGVLVAPLSVTIDSKTYREYEEISSREFLDIIAQGHIPVSSQPAVGEVLEGYESCGEEDCINITMALGLSATYEGAMTAREQASNKDKITVVNSKTLCGPHQHMVLKAVKMAQKGATKDEILAMLEEMIATSKSFLIPDDFDYLKRGGRLAPLAANMVGKLKVIPVVVQAHDGEALAPFRISRKINNLFADIARAFEKHGVGKGWVISVAHADNISRAQAAQKFFANVFPDSIVEILELSPCFITQGGPRCVSIQTIKL